MWPQSKAVRGALLFVAVLYGVELLDDTRHRRSLVLGGISATAVGLSLIAVAQQYLPLLLAMGILYVASGAYVYSSSDGIYHPE